MILWSAPNLLQSQQEISGSRLSKQMVSPFRQL